MNPQATHSPGELIRVRGLVQGVGFRPTVYRLARTQGLNGEVLNDGEGVLIRLYGNRADIEHFIAQMHEQCPPLARIDSIERKSLKDGASSKHFRIVASQRDEIRTGVVADAATCRHCLDDINNPHNRRNGYAFTNCTHCGPRLSIVSDIPYDRANTSMAPFTQCPDCQREYEDPSDRRFHAQPNACPHCGPRLWLCDPAGDQVSVDDTISETAGLLQSGKIIAIKGIGGFQLACDASNDEAVKTLRRRKHRPHKSLALMASGVEQVARYARLGTQQREALQSYQAPIVVLDQCSDCIRLSAHLAPDNNTLGFMLPYSPLHHLLMQKLDAPIVLTSGNRSEEPQCIDNEQALQRLGDIADYFLMHDRDIVNRVDDSVVRFADSGPVFYRRARGYAPSPLPLPKGIDPDLSLLACGGEMKNTFALVKDGQAILSQHMGNLENSLTFEDYRRNLDLYTRLYRFEPKAVVIDQHPQYLSSQYGEALAAERDLPLLKIQHHHAHIAACLADNGYPFDGEAVLGVALDGLGLGDDGTIWGGEVLRCDYLDYQRLARFKPAPMPGATKAILEPWRNTYAQLTTHCDWADLNQHFSHGNLLHYLKSKPISLVERMIDNQLNSPMTSSCGRLFDAVAAAVGLFRDHISFEGQAAMALEAQIEPAAMTEITPYPFELEHGDTTEINPGPMWQALMRDLDRGERVSYIAARFHRFVAEAILATLIRLRETSGIERVALSGGVFQNITLFNALYARLIEHDFKVMHHINVPTNDGGLALGQASIAATRLLRGKTS